MNLEEEIRLKRTQIFDMSEINPDNIFGINSYQMIRPKKILNKFEKMMEFVKLEKEDEKDLIEKKIKAIG